MTSPAQINAHHSSGNIQLNANTQHIHFNKGTPLNGRPPDTLQNDGFFHIPFDRNIYFTGREEILMDLDLKFQNQSTSKTGSPIRIALVGLGGAGKSSVALEFAYRYRNQYAHVLWVVADSRETLATEFQTLAQQLPLQTEDITDEESAKLHVLRWLSRNKNWLLVMDNADNLNAI